MKMVSKIKEIQLSSLELWFGFCFVWKIICGGLFKMVSKIKEIQSSNVEA